MRAVALTVLYAACGLQIFHSEIALAAGKCVVDYSELGEQIRDAIVPPLGPRRIAVSVDEAQQIRAHPNSFYRTAKSFSANEGNDFVEMVGARLPANGRVTVVVAMGGAEHLGTLLESQLAHRYPHLAFDVRYVDLSTPVLGNWKVSRPHDPDSDWSYDVYRTGIGPHPYDHKKVRTYRHDVNEIQRHLVENSTLSNPVAFVIDTGFNGSTVEAVAHVARSLDTPVHVEGFLIYKASNTESTVPTFSLNGSMGASSSERAAAMKRIAVMHDNNNSVGSESPEILDAFQRSAQILSDGDPALINYKATLVGLFDGAKEVSSKPNQAAKIDANQVRPTRMILPAKDPALGADVPPEIASLWRTNLPFAERAGAREKVLNWLNTLEQSGRQDRVRRFAEDLISGADRLSPSYGAQLNLLGSPVVLRSIEGKSQSVPASVRSIDDFFAIHSSIRDSLEKVHPTVTFVERVRRAKGEWGPHHGARNLSEFRSAVASMAFKSYRRETEQIANSFARPLKVVPRSGESDPKDYLAQIARADAKTLRQLWEALGLGREFIQRFPNSEDFWKSSNTFEQVYNELLSSQLRPTRTL